MANLPSSTHVEVLPEILLNSYQYDPDSGTLGIAKKFLQHAYVEIRQDYTSLSKKLRNRTANEEEVSRLLDMTTIVLIETTENLKAINNRKIIVSHYPENQSLDNEIWFLNILFSSPLQKHTKSPMLWQHRKWILHQKIGRDPSHQIDDLALFADQEFDIISRAGELHSKNYYAWAYARWLVDTITRQINLPRLAERIYALCNTHVSDISMWTFLEHVLELNNDEELSLRYAEETLQNTELYPGHESMWCFIRTIFRKQNRPL